jgi:hypothetical protein
LQEVRKLFGIGTQADASQRHLDCRSDGSAPV